MKTRSHGSFCTAINCMDGRFQEPVIAYLKKRFRTAYVDMITEPGPNKTLAEGRERPKIRSIHARVKISVERHGSVGIAIVGHEDCAGNPAGRPQQEKELRAAVKAMARAYPGVPVLALWVPLSGPVEEIRTVRARM